MAHAYEFELLAASEAPPALAPVAPAGPEPAVAEFRVEAVRDALCEYADEAGTLGAALRYQFETGGKLLRARLACEAGRALGLDAVATTAIAAICELLHAASLIHDDLQDGDSYRRGRRALWAEFGDDVAINTGDFLIARAFAVATSLDADARVRVAVAERVAECVTRLTRGQDEERDFVGTLDATLEAYEGTAREKCAPLLSLPVELALLVAGAPAGQLAAATHAMDNLGTAYQLQDDLLDVCGGKGRAPGSDLRAGRATAPVLLYASRCEALRRAQLEEFLFFAPINPGAAEGWRAAIVLSDAVDATLARCALWQQSARVGFEPLPRALRAALRRLTRELFEPALQLQAERFDYGVETPAGAA